MENQTANILVEMLAENTGRHMLDSGGAYGRNWEKNQSKVLADFQNQPEASIEFHVDNDGTASVWGCTLNIFHFLNERLDFAVDLDSTFQEFAALPENEKESWHELARMFPGYLKGRGQGCEFEFCRNTYNGEDALSQVIEYTQFRLEDETYIALLIHGGCDVRGGYTKPRIFHVPEEGSYLYDNANVTVVCEGGDDFRQLPIPGVPESSGPHGWDSECGGYSWTGHDGSKSLFDYPAKEIDNPSDAVPGAFCIDKDGKGYCPICAAPLFPVPPYGGG